MRCLLWFDAMEWSQLASNGRDLYTTMSYDYHSSTIPMSCVSALTRYPSYAGGQGIDRVQPCVPRDHAVHACMQRAGPAGPGRRARGDNSNLDRVASASAALAAGRAQRPDPQGRRARRRTAAGRAGSRMALCMPLYARAGRHACMQRRAACPSGTATRIEFEGGEADVSAYLEAGEQALFLFGCERVDACWGE